MPQGRNEAIGASVRPFLLRAPMLPTTKEASRMSQPEPPSYTISSFCLAENITRPVYYKLKRQGLGPKEMRYGRVVRISSRARSEWQRAREKSTEVQQRHDAKMHERALVAGAAAAASPLHVSKNRSA
jgi:hypothetical protein